MKPICHACRRFYRVKKTGYYFVEGRPLGNDTKPGMDEAGNWVPYKVWVGDLWHCLGCGHHLVSGFGASPIAVHHEPDFDGLIERCGAGQFQVNDC